MKTRRLLGCVWAIAIVVGSSEGAATPFYSVDSGSRCNTCHVEPLGWANPERHRERACTLDCSGCHVSPTGGGARRPMGRFYGEEVLPMFGRRPSDAADPERHRPEGYPSEGRYALWSGFEGWWPGDVDFRTIEDRLGHIDPTPIWHAGGDLRAMVVAPTDGNADRDVAAFPMEAQAYLSVNPVEHLNAYLDLGYQGSTRDGVNGGGSDRSIGEMLWLRELHLMWRTMPFNTYVRAGRLSLPYGWRVSDHTAYIRRGVFDQYRQAFGGEVGLAANYGWGNLMLWRQGADWWPGDTQPPGVGVTAQGGIRTLGFQLGLSGHMMQGQEGTSDEAAFGPMWAVNLRPVTILGEMDWRRNVSPRLTTDSITVYHEARLTVLRVLTPRFRWEWTDPDVLVRDDQRWRIVPGLQWNPLRYLQVDIAYRYEHVAGGQSPSEILVQIHSWLR